MGFYAQQNYLQHLGTSNSVTISEAGCLLTSVSNGLLKMTGSAPDPATLNSFFIGHGAYVWDAADGANDDLTWGSISLYDPSIRLTKVGSGSLPDSSNAIVKFHYNSVHTGRPIDHYCWVDHIEGRDVYIIDSWDGLIKGPGGYQGVYHLPVAWATFERVPVAAPSPAPVAPKFQVTETYPQGKQIRLNKQPTKLWGMNYADPGANAPIEVHNIGEEWTVTNKVHHINGYDYYRRDGQVDGFNVLDCDYVPPPAPYVPPAAPLKPKLVEPFIAKVKLMVFANAADAKGRHNYIGEDIEPGDYIVIEKDEQAYLLSKDNKNDIGWVNAFDNKLPEVSNVIVPEPSNVPTLPTDAPATDITLPVDVKQPDIILTNSIEDVKAKPQYLWIRDDRSPVTLTSTNTVPVQMLDLEGKWPPQKLPAKITEQYTMYADVKGTRYYIMERCRSHGWMFGVSEHFLPTLPKATMTDRDANGRADIIDLFDNGLQGFIETSTKYFDGLSSVVRTSAPKLTQAKQRITKAVDGFSKRTK